MEKEVTLTRTKLVNVDADAWKSICKRIGNDKIKNPVRSRLLSFMVDDYLKPGEGILAKINGKDFSDSKMDRLSKRILRDILR